MTCAEYAEQSALARSLGFEIDDRAAGYRIEGKTEHGQEIRTSFGPAFRLGDYHVFADIPGRRGWCAARLEGEVTKHAGHFMGHHYHASLQAALEDAIARRERDHAIAT
jgi:hypothetical protein